MRELAHTPPVSDIPFRPTRAARRAVEVERRASGVLLLRHPSPLPPHRRTIIECLHHWSAQRPDHTMLAQRGGDDAWRRISYRQMHAQADAIAQALLDLGVTSGQRILILSGNSLEHAVMMLGAMTIGVATAPISPAYSLMSEDHRKLRSVFDTVKPALVFAQSGAHFMHALAALDLGQTPIVVAANRIDTQTHLFADLATTAPSAAVSAAYAGIGPDTVAKILFTSGSTGWPKGVINTQRMMCANIAMADAMMPPPTDGGPNPTVSWAPWNHTMAGNVLFNLNLHHGDTYYIDDGRPLPGEYQRTVRNLAEIAPRTLMDVPASFTMLAAHLEADPKLRARLFANFEYLTYAGAGLPNEVFDRIQAAAIAETGKRIAFQTGYGATETSPGVLQTYWATERSGVVGLPYPGLEVKLAPLADGRHEVRVRGPTVTPGYLDAPAANAKAFDDEGFYCMGDAVRWVDERDPEQGLSFAGRIAEDFKLLTGTFVNVGALRLNLVNALAPLARDAVITGHDRACVGALVWLNVPACRAFLGAAADSVNESDLAAAPALAVAFARGLATYNAAHRSSSTRVERLLLLSSPPSVDANEITDKGYVNQAAALALRAADVERLYATPIGAGVITA